MPEQDLIDVRVIVQGQALQEYPEPEATDEGTDHVRYIEAKAGQEFGIQITWRAGFDLKWADALHYKFRVDHIVFYTYGQIQKQDIYHRRGTLTNDVSTMMESLMLKNDTTGDWEACPYVFGVLGMTDDGPIDLTLKPEDIQNMGSIRIEVYRANKVKRDEPYFWSGERQKTLDEISEKLLKGRALKNNVQFPNGPRATAPQGEHFKYNPMPGIEGTLYEFKFLYRTKKILQSLGCVPRSPSPSPDRQLALERAEDTIRLEKQRAREANLEILRLREELARSRSGSRQISVLTDSDPFVPARIRGGSNARSYPTHQTPYIKKEHNEPRSLGSRITHPHPPLFTGNNGSQKNPRVEIVDLSGETRATGPRRDLSVADEVNEILRSVEQRNDVSEEAARTPAQKKRKKPVEDDDDDIVELPPTKTRKFEIVDLTDS